MRKIYELKNLFEKMNLIFFFLIDVGEDKAREEKEDAGRVEAIKSKII